MKALKQVNLSLTQALFGHLKPYHLKRKAQYAFITSIASKRTRRTHKLSYNPKRDDMHVRLFLMGVPTQDRGDCRSVPSV